MVERDVAEELGQRNAKSLRYLTECVLGEVPVALVHGVQDREQWGRLGSPPIEDLPCRG
jgi:hypothetical protein